MDIVKNKLQSNTNRLTQAKLAVYISDLLELKVLVDDIKLQKELESTLIELKSLEEKLKTKNFTKPQASNNKKINVDKQGLRQYQIEKTAEKRKLDENIPIEPSKRFKAVDKRNKLAPKRIFEFSSNKENCQKFANPKEKPHEKSDLLLDLAQLDSYQKDFDNEQNELDLVLKRGQEMRNTAVQLGYLNPDTSNIFKFDTSIEKSVMPEEQDKNIGSISTGLPLPNIDSTEPITEIAITQTDHYFDLTYKNEPDTQDSLFTPLHLTVLGRMLSIDTVTLGNAIVESHREVQELIKNKRNILSSSIHTIGNSYVECSREVTVSRRWNRSQRFKHYLRSNQGCKLPGITRI